MSIPKIIHYCWFGGKPLPKSAIKCIKSWNKFFPDYEIKRWDESNFDVNIIPYTQQAYESKKYAFVSDYARFWILYKYGGVYFDTDVEVIQSMNDILMAGPFMGCENSYQKEVTPDSSNVASGYGLGVNPGLGLGVSAGFPLINDLMEIYHQLTFSLKHGESNPDTVVTYTTKLLCEKGLKNSPDIQEIDGMKIYPKDYFCPISTFDGTLRITQNTRSIHHYDQSWQSPTRKYGRKIILLLGGVKLKNIIKNLIFRN